MKDLVVLVPDKNTQFVLDGLLPRHQALQIRPIEYDIFVHPERDPGVYHKAPEFLAPFHNHFGFALVFFDREGSGQERKPIEELEADLVSRISLAGWRNRVEVIVFDPELEIWAWADSPHLAANLGWDGQTGLVHFIHEEGFWKQNAAKPDRPKEAIEAALGEKKIPRSSAAYKRIASQVSFRDCQEPSFLKFRTTIEAWFRAEERT